jgi:hypothetical protein
LVAAGELLAEDRGAVQRLVDVTDQVEQPGRVDGLVLVGPRPDRVRRDRQLGDDVRLAGGWLVVGRPDGRPGRDDRVVDVMPRRVVVVAVAADPVGPGGGPQEDPLVLGEPLGPAGGEVLVVVRVLLEDGDDRALALSLANETAWEKPVGRP